MQDAKNAKRDVSEYKYSELFLKIIDSKNKFFSLICMSCPARFHLCYTVTAMDPLSITASALTLIHVTGIVSHPLPFAVAQIGL